MERDQGTGRQRADRDADAQCGRSPAETVFDLRGRVRGERRIDEPRFERSRIERPIDPLEDHRDHEHRHRVRDREEPYRRDRDQRGEQQDRPATEGVGEASRRQLQGEDDESLRGEHHADLGQAQPAGQRDEHEDGCEEADRQPAKRGQQQEPALRVPGVEDAHAGSPPSAGANGKR